MTTLLLSLIVIQFILINWLFLKNRRYITEVMAKQKTITCFVDDLLEVAFPPKFKAFDEVESVRYSWNYSRVIRGKVIEVYKQRMIKGERRYLVLVEKEYLGNKDEPPFNFIDTAHPYTEVYDESALTSLTTPSQPLTVSNNPESKPDEDHPREPEK